MKKEGVDACLKDILENINFYRRRFLNSHKREDEIRHLFSVLEFRTLKYSIDASEISRKKMDYARKRYDSLFPNRDTFSPNRKF